MVEIKYDFFIVITYGDDMYAVVSELLLRRSFH